MRTLTGSLLARGDEALWSAGALTDSRGWFDSAYQLAEQQQDGPAMAAAALGYAGLWVDELRRSTATAVVGDRLRRALAAVPADSLPALRLRTRLAAEADYRAGGHAGALAFLAQARAAADPVATADALRLAHQCLLGPEHGSRRLELAQALIAEGPRTGRRGDLLVGMLLRAVDLLLVADPGAARRLAEVRRLLDVGDYQVLRVELEAIEVMAEIRAGRLESAEPMAKQCAQDGEAAGCVAAVTIHGAQLVAIRWFQGRIGELLPMVRELADSPLLSPIDYSFRATLAVAAAAAGERREALRAIAAFQDRLADIPSSASWLPCLYALIEASLLLQCTDVAAEAYRLMLPYRGLPMMAGLGSACFGSVEQALGVAQLAMGDFDGAVPHLRQAVRDNDTLGNRPAAALSRQRLAYALDRAGAPVAAGTDAAAGPSCHRRGKLWEIMANGRKVVVEHSRGMAYLAVLLSNPGAEITAVELAGGPGMRHSPSSAATGEAASRPFSGQAVLDERAIGDYRARLAQLRRVIGYGDVPDEDGGPETADDPERARAARAELVWLLTELRAATGPAGRRRVFATDEERARIAVGKAIRRALARITELDQQLGALISAGVRTGRVCAYAPPA